MALRGIFRRLGKGKLNQTTRNTALVVVDDTDELHAAVTYASHRASEIDMDVVLLRINQPQEEQNWMFVGDLIAREARDEAVGKLQEQAEHVRRITGQQPQLYMREGNPADELLRFVRAHDGIRVLVLASADKKGAPGPLVEAVTGKLVGKLPIPVVIVPGHMRDLKTETTH